MLEKVVVIGLSVSGNSKKIRRILSVHLVVQSKQNKQRQQGA